MGIACLPFLAFQFQQMFDDPCKHRRGVSALLLDRQFRPGDLGVALALSSSMAVHCADISSIPLPLQVLTCP